MKILYSTLVQLHILYGINLSIIFKENYSALEKKVVRLINKSEYNAHTAKSFKTCNILTLKSMYELETAKFIFDCIHKTLPKPLMEHFTLNTGQYTTKSRTSCKKTPHLIVLLLVQYYTKVPQYGKFTP